MGKGPEKAATAAYFLMWGLFTLLMFIGTLKLNKAMQFVFLSLAVLFFLLFIRDAANNTLIGKIAGYEGIICGLSAVYTGIAQVLNEMYGRVVMPLGTIKPAADKRIN